MASPFASPAAVTNAATQLVGGYNNQGPVTGTPPEFDGSTLGIAAGAIYDEVVDAVARSWGYDFSRNLVGMGLTGNTAPFNLLYEYAYPTNGIQIRQVVPAPGTITDTNNPHQINWTVGFATVGGTPTKVVWTNQIDAYALITGQPPEALWDALFAEAVVRELGAKLAVAVFGKLDLMRELGETGEQIQGLSQTRDS